MYADTNVDSGAENLDTISILFLESLMVDQLNSICFFHSGPSGPSLCAVMT